MRLRQQHPTSNALAFVLFLSSLTFVFGFLSIESTRAADGKKSIPATKYKIAGKKYTCPMHPHYIANDFGPCPICGMDLVPLQTGDSADAETSPDKRQSITISPETIQNMGVRTAQAEMAQFGREIRAYGIIKENERLQYAITNRLDGWIEELKIKAVGDPVTKGDMLYKIYSPELFVAQRDYLSMSKSGRFRQRADFRLRTYGVQNKTIKKLARDRQAMMNVPFYAESDGIVSKLEVSKGSFVKRGAMLAMVQDYSSVWLVVSVAEQDLGFLSGKSIAKVTFPTLKDKQVTAKIDYIYPTIDSASRTGQVRLVVDNKDGNIRPGTYADVVFEIGAKQKLSIPSESLLNSETGRYVIVAKGEGRFEPRNVKTGLTSGSLTEIVDGLKRSDAVVVSGQFLLDSESALRESFRKLERLQTPLPLLDLNKVEMAMVDHLVDAALYLHEAIVDGYDIDPKFLQPAIDIKIPLWPKYKHTQLAFVMNGAEVAIKKAQKARTDTALYAALDELVKELKPWIMTGKPDHYQSKKLNIFKETKGGKLWIQQGDKPFNPYNRAKTELIPWPEDKSKTDEKKETEKKAQKLGSHAGGSHAQ